MEVVNTNERFSINMEDISLPFAININYGKKKKLKKLNVSTNAKDKVVIITSTFKKYNIFTSFWCNRIIYRSKYI